MTRGLGDLLGLTEQRNFTFNLLPIYLGALPVHKNKFECLFLKAQSVPSSVAYFPGVLPRTRLNEFLLFPLICRFCPSVNYTVLQKPGKSNLLDCLKYTQSLRVGVPCIPCCLKRLRACKRVGIEDLRFHDLRHEATSRFFEKGLHVMEVAAITGHKDLRMLKRYTHLRAEDLVLKLGLY